MNDLPVGPRMTVSAHFMSISVFDQQGCRALTFALARLSCFDVVVLLIAGDRGATVRYLPPPE